MGDADRGLTGTVVDLPQPAAQVLADLGIEGAEPMLGDAAAYAQRIRRESEKWGAVVRSSGATV